eukprot:CAMPEP_0172543722 /NCGR_PEP_ID=MMETSP1067-20121228/14030_1 /TAXON_ID=265564 ORGANISM="Thalassiosira punctigera, Strain Tpunct2005C2" /NCGR_SAMPLE_ID=MMETSP1067 /ASSEMBLY_ACC=CAM_ASM_000444 /LENGTH=93 /DNA_ID=CAMNT_0013330183 /DNA_START=17 /DNA_END=295 /DNA_ORIENTATION=-
MAIWSSFAPSPRGHRATIIGLLCGAALLALLLPNNDDSTTGRLQRRLQIDVGGIDDSSQHVLVIQADEGTLIRARHLLEKQLSLKEGLAALKD